MDNFSVPANPGRSLLDARAFETFDFLTDFNKNSIFFQCRPFDAARSRTLRHSKPLIFLMIFNKKSIFFQSRPLLALAPGRRGTQNR